MCVTKTYKQAACTAGIMELSCQDSSFQTLLTTAYSEKSILHHDPVTHIGTFMYAP